MGKLLPNLSFWSFFSKISSYPRSSPKHSRCILELIRSSYCVSERSIEPHLWFLKIENFQWIRDVMKSTKSLGNSISDGFLGFWMPPVSHGTGSQTTYLCIATRRALFRRAQRVIRRQPRASFRTARKRHFGGIGSKFPGFREIQPFDLRSRNFPIILQWFPKFRILQNSKSILLMGGKASFKIVFWPFFRKFQVVPDRVLSTSDVF